MTAARMAVVLLLLLVVVVQQMGLLMPAAKPATALAKAVMVEVQLCHIMLMDRWCLETLDCGLPRWVSE